MDIFTIQKNLQNTIAGKEAMLAGLRKDQSTGYYVLSNMLEINIDELKKILEDVDVVATKTLNEIYRNG